MSINELLAEYADEARSYDVGRRALEIGRRRRRLVRAVPVAAAAMVIAVGAGVVFALQPDGHAPGPVPPASSAPTTPPTTSPTTPPAWAPLPPVPLAEYPTVIAPQDAPALPATPVRRGVYLYQRSVNGHERTYLVVAGGQQYRVDTDATGASSLFTLSPDGAWLVERHGTDDQTATTLRALTHAETREVSGGPAAWSADSRWFATQTSRGAEEPEGDRTVRIVDLASPAGTPGQVTISNFDSPRFLNDEGNPVLARFASGTALDFITIARSTGQVASTVHVDYAARLSQTERDTNNALVSSLDNPRGGLDMRVTSDGRAAIQLWVDTGVATVAGDVIVVDIASGNVMERWQLPTPHQRESWALDQVREEGLLLRHGGAAGRIALEFYDIGAKKLEQITDLRPLQP